MPPVKRILFVCLGNICRSPAAEGVLKARAAAREFPIFVDSAGVSAAHIGEPPDARMIAACARRGVDIARQRARRLDVDDYAAFDYALAMDFSVMADIMARAPAGRRAEIRLFLDFAQTAERETPDPYYGASADFERVLDLIETGVDAFLDHLERA